jgi:hypothetical protein
LEYQPSLPSSVFSRFSLTKRFEKAHGSDTWVIFVGYFLFIGIVSRDESVERVQGSL